MKKDEKQTNPHKTTQKLRTVHAAEKKRFNMNPH